MLRQDIRKVILSPYFYISIVLVAIFLYIGSAGETTPDFLYLYWCARFAGMISYIMPMLAGLAVADIYCVERKNGYHYTMLIRSDKTTYCLSKIFVAALTGMLVTLLGVALYAIICMLTVDGPLQIATEQATYQQYVQNADENPRRLLDRLGVAQNWWGMLAFQLVFFATYSMIWPVMSLATAVFTNNRYIVIAFPVLFVNLMSTVTASLSGGWGQLNPIILSESGGSNYMNSLPADGLPFQIGMVALYILICGIIFRIGVGKHLK